MSGSKHTPGPWTTDLHGIIIAAPTQVSNTQSRIAQMLDYHCPVKPLREMQEANAKLMAAAPEMANLLKEWQCFVLHGTSRRYSEREMLEWTASVLAKAGL